MAPSSTTTSGLKVPPIVVSSSSQEQDSSSVFTTHVAEKEPSASSLAPTSTGMDSILKVPPAVSGLVLQDLSIDHHSMAGPSQLPKSTPAVPTPLVPDEKSTFPSTGGDMISNPWLRSSPPVVAHGETHDHPSHTQGPSVPALSSTKISAPTIASSQPSPKVTSIEAALSSPFDLSQRNSFGLYGIPPQPWLLQSAAAVVSTTTSTPSSSVHPSPAASDSVRIKVPPSVIALATATTTTSDTSSLSESPPVAAVSIEPSPGVDPSLKVPPVVVSLARDAKPPTPRRLLDSVSVPVPEEPGVAPSPSLHMPTLSPYSSIWGGRESSSRLSPHTVSFWLDDTPVLTPSMRMRHESSGTFPPIYQTSKGANHENLDMTSAAGASSTILLVLSLFASWFLV
eukprot:CAMPEP_0116833860 /NCGR_PEP_ID=MMETSP0418-20121206/6674_1 /TAXON_ID=1158023 /ORGANISM="Astrosyne radiata, Strain 13vi08-1A" /LENGTH=396 /DNA_ID=CAMNT_0004463363 /DNA_START=1584 /DNA_END=2774 /DNA_ORIENTATION=-